LFINIIHQESIMFRGLVGVLLALGLIGCAPRDQSPSVATNNSSATNGAGETALETDEQRILYALGIALGNNVGEFSLTANEVDIVSLGFRDAALGETYQVDMAEYGARIEELATERAAAANSVEREASVAFADALAREAGAEVSESGLVFISMVEGTGANPAASDTVRVHYHGTLRDGTVFDSSVDRGEPISFPLMGVIPCWTEGVQKIRVGGKAKLGCPAEIAYGESGTGPIPGGATLLFEVELLGIE
jgi:FKBP-type peptidyl-prolyl cis-trans isomerase FkpA